MDLTVDPNSFVCRDASDLRALHERIARELPKRELTVEEAANEALEAVEEMQGMLKDVREVSEVLDTQEEMREVRVALENLWMMLAGIAAVEEDRRLKAKTAGVIRARTKRRLRRSLPRYLPPAGASSAQPNRYYAPLICRALYPSKSRSWVATFSRTRSGGISTACFS